MHNQADTRALLNTLRSIPLFEGLADTELSGMLESLENGIETYDAKALIVRESEIGNACTSSSRAALKSSCAAAAATVKSLSPPWTRVISSVNNPCCRAAKEIKELLGSMRLFRSLTPVEIETFRHWLQVIEVGPGEFVIKEYFRVILNRDTKLSQTLTVLGN